jgi:peptide/nickel transport system ATP-binding protein
LSVTESAQALGSQGDHEAVVRVRDLVVEYHGDAGYVRAVDHVSVDIRRGEIIGLVGESGCGKTTLGNALLRLINPPHRIAEGRIEFQGVGNVLALSRAQLAHYRWERISYVFQSAQNALNPLLTIEQQARVVMQSHRAIGPEAVRRRLTDLLQLVNLEPARVLHAFPHELSGGMKQRVGVAMALLLEPALIVLDEPTTALDVLSQAMVLTILRQVHDNLGTTMVFITHDMSVIAELCDRVAVMYAGRLVELAPVDEIFEAPRHPYTKALLGAVPSLEGDPLLLEAIPGQPPDLRHPPRGCRFAPRCPVREPRCEVEDPALHPIGPDHAAACLLLQGPPRGGEEANDHADV